MRSLLIAAMLVVAPATGSHEAPAPERPISRSSAAGDKCLADAIYFEAKGEDRMGKILVAEVVLNRVEHPAFPKTICGVIKQPGAFPWPRNRGPLDVEAYQEAVSIAVALRSGGIERKHRSLLWFHNPKTASKKHLSESWRKNIRLALRHGRHAFFRERNS